MDRQSGSSYGTHKTTIIGGTHNITSRTTRTRRETNIRNEMETVGTIEENKRLAEGLNTTPMPPRSGDEN